MTIAVGERLRAMRERRGMPISTLAKRAGMSRTTIYQIEGGHSAPRLDILNRLAVALEVSVLELIPEPAGAVA